MIKHNDNRQNGIGATQVVITIVVITLVIAIIMILINQASKKTDTNTSGQSSDVSQSPIADENDKKSARELVETAYSGYIEETDRIVALKNFSSYTTTGLQQSLDATQSLTDPVLCTQDTPKSVTVTDVTIDPNTKLVSAMVEISYNESKSIVKVSVNTIENKINAIVCEPIS